MSRLLHLLQSLSLIDYVLFFSVVILLILIVSLIYIVRSADEELEEIEKIEDGEIDLKEIAAKINTRPEPLIDMTKYEAEQEEKSIISYEELINTAKIHTLNYSDEETLGDEITVKKVDLDSLQKQTISALQFNETETKEDFIENVLDYPPKINVKLMRYEHEESFLAALQKLRDLLE